MKDRTHLRNIIRILITGILLLLFLFVFQVNEFQSLTSVKGKHATNHQIQIRDAPLKDDKKVETTLSHSQITFLVNKFMELLVQDTSDRYRVNRFSTKKELLEAFETVSSKEVAIEYIDYYYVEKEDGLYIIPTETPPWFNENNGYDKIQINNKQFKVLQRNQSDLYGDYLIEYEITFDSDWKITKITHSEKGDVSYHLKMNEGS